jgi:hypothetical protein
MMEVKSTNSHLVVFSTLLIVCMARTELFASPMYLKILTMETNLLLVLSRIFV